MRRYAVGIMILMLMLGTAFSSVTGMIRTTPGSGEGVSVLQLGGSAGSDGFVLVKGGTFWMGNTRAHPDGKTWEAPFKVTLTYDYLIGKHEVTFAQFNEFCKDYPGRTPVNASTLGNPDTRPAANMSWYDAIVYCNWLSTKAGLPVAYGTQGASLGRLLDADGQVTTDITKVVGYRLPTDAEWEYAARGGHADIVNGVEANDYWYAGSDTVGDVAWYDANTPGGIYERTRPVGAKAPNELGIHDMSGNVREWIHDWYNQSLSTYPRGNPTNPLGRVNPIGPPADSGNNKVVRGGSYRDAWNQTMLFRYGGGRDYQTPTDKQWWTGFRVARTVPGSSITPQAEWAVFSVHGKIELTGSSWIKPKNAAQPSGSVGTNANDLVSFGGARPIILGGGGQSVIHPCGNFYFGPGANKQDLVGGANLGEGRARLNCLINNGMINSAIQTFFDPSTEMTLDFPGLPQRPEFPATLPSRGSTQTSWSPEHFSIVIDKSGHYSKIETIHADHSLVFKVGDADLVVSADVLNTLGSVTVERSGNGGFYLHANSATFGTNAANFTIDIGNADTLFSFNSVTFSNKLQITNVQEQGSFTLFANSADIWNSQSTLRLNQQDMIMRFGTLKIRGSTDWVLERVGSLSGNLLVFVETELDLSANTKLRSSDGKYDSIHLFYKGTTPNFTFGQFHLHGSVYSDSSDVEITGSSIVNSIMTKGSLIDLKGNGTSAENIFSINAQVKVTGSATLKGGVVTGGDYVQLLGNPTPPKLIWAPNADVEISGSAGVEGTVIGKNIKVTGDSKISYELVARPSPVVPFPNRGIPEVPEPDPCGFECDLYPTFLITLCLNTRGISVGNMHIESEAYATKTFNDGKNHAFNHSPFTVILSDFHNNNDKIRVQLWGYPEWYWRIWNGNNKNPIFDQFFTGNNFRVIAIYVNDYTGTITVYNDSSTGARIKIINQKGHTNGNQIPAGKVYSATYRPDQDNWHWKQE